MGGEDTGIAPTCLLSRLGQLRLEVLFSSLSGAVLALWLYRGLWLNLMNAFLSISCDFNSDFKTCIKIMKDIFCLLTCTYLRLFPSFPPPKT